MPAVQRQDGNSSCMVTEINSTIHVYAAPRMESDGSKYTFTFLQPDGSGQRSTDLDPVTVDNQSRPCSLRRSRSTQFSTTGHWELTSALYTRSEWLTWPRR